MTPPVATEPNNLPSKARERPPTIDRGEERSG